jgi:hypothetical protein
VLVVVAVLIWFYTKQTGVAIPLPQPVYNTMHPSAPPAFLVNQPTGTTSRFTALESIRITRENYKPFVKTV